VRLHRRRRCSSSTWIFSRAYCNSLLVVAPANWPRESVEDGNDQLDGDQTLEILLGFAMVHVSIQG
jgi:hypothetical protein